MALVVYQVGSFPPLWSEWNDKYRDDVRDFWRGESGIAGIGWRLSGSQDIYGGDGTDPYTSINFVTAHDGFTMRDLVSFNHKHNEANLEENRDGTDNNRSYNYGVEGETTDPQIIETRSRQIRNFLATLFLSGGVPMLMAGDELHRTQQGNNNSYCQDNAISWINWDLQQEDWDLVDFTATLAHIRATHPALRPLGFFTGNPHFDNGPKDLAWFAPNAHEIEHWHSGVTFNDWHVSHPRPFGIALCNLSCRCRTSFGHTAGCPLCPEVHADSRYECHKRCPNERAAQCGRLHHDATSFDLRHESAYMTKIPLAQRKLGVRFLF